MRNEVKRLMIEHKVSQKVAQSAWDALCDGNYLANCDPLYDVDDDVDPWDGQHEELRKRVEAEAIEEAKADAIQEAKNERTFNFF